MSEWIKVSEQQPPKHGIFLALRDGTAHILCVFDEESHVRRNITHWMPIPKLPPKESSFEQWWSDRPAEITSNFHRWVAGQLVHEQSAKTIWDAAIAASKRPDFVP